ncbi:MAG: hypothetical protein MJ240_00970 [Kiritimatiellae bacterium]|nr:hypothetical protein [Kiritimatiellia bacterium]
MKNLAILLFVSVVALMCGCTSTPSARGPIPAKYYSKAELEDMDEVKLPPNYSVDNFRKMQMIMNVKVESADGKTKINKSLSTRMQTEMAKLKRFEIFSLHNRSKVELDAIGDLDDQVKVVEAGNVKASDLILMGTIKVTTAINELHNDKVYVYSADGDFSCEDAKTRTVYFAEKARGVWDRKVRYSLTGQAHGNVSEEQAIQIACLRCLAIVANKLGNTFPTGGRVTNITGSGDTMVMKAGQHEGIAPNQQVCVFLSEDGLDIPVAFAEATPKNDGTSQLRVYRWNTDNSDAKAIVKEIRGSARGFLKNYKGDDKNGLYAVAFGMATPADWEQNVTKQ